MPKLNDLTGKRFGRLVVIERAENSGKRVMWKCRCDCGKEIITRCDNLTSGGSKSCGCYNKEQSSKKHRKKTILNKPYSKTRVYSVWSSMKQRCYNKNCIEYQNYGARGITVCDEWLHDSQAFVDWAMANGYRDDLTIDRKDVNGNYCPENCRWATQEEQANNKRTNHYLTYNNETHTIKEWARMYNLSENGLTHRILRGWDVERALTKPMQKKNKKR